ncbi:MAG: DUF192 domain-containing protein [Patescibacteria group bacterium]|nr:DUF192 domain-containing protein [Patescibacteria group bacterium]
MKLKAKDYLFIGLVIICSVLFAYQKLFNSDDENKIIPRHITAMVGHTTIRADVAQTPEEMHEGLGGRESMGKDKGMLFIHELPGRHKYGMRGMLFDLDLIFIKDGVVVDIAKSVSTKYKGKIEGGDDYNYVLEMNADWVRKNDIKIGDKFISEDL